MIYYLIISFLLYPIASSFNEVNELKKWEWHTSQLIERACAINLGIAIGLYGLDLIGIAKAIPLSAAVFWITYDIILSHYGYKGLQSKNFFDRHTYLKIPLLIGTICLNLF